MRRGLTLAVAALFMSACDAPTTPKAEPAVKVPPAAVDTADEAKRRAAITTCGKKYGAQGTYGDETFLPTLEKGLAAAGVGMNTFMQCVVNQS